MTTATGFAPFAGMADDELDELRRSIMHSLALNAEEEIELKAQQRLLRAEVRLRNAKQMEAITDRKSLREVSE